jgi:2-polyprenyl-3-methyl-5-hydroxy-6-metoxy-1,4-benzoquinol methylase
MPIVRGLVVSFACLFAESHAQSNIPDAHESERRAYDEIYSRNRAVFTTEPNAFMVRMIRDRKPGRALDVAMGQGRNALWLAAQGWAVTGFDSSPVAIDEARKEAAKRGLQIETLVTPLMRSLIGAWTNGT